MVLPLDQSWPPSIFRTNSRGGDPGRNMKSIVKLLPVLLFALAPAAFADSVIYNTIPSPLPSNLVSEPYEAVQSYEFGGLIQFAGSSPSYNLTSATLAMSDWALLSSYTPNGTTI